MARRVRVCRDISRSQGSDAPGLLGRTFNRSGPQMRVAASAAATATFVLNDDSRPGSRGGAGAARKPLAASQADNKAVRRGDAATFAGLKELLEPCVNVAKGAVGLGRGGAVGLAAGAVQGGAAGGSTVGEATAMKRHLQGAAAFGRVAKRRP